MPKIGGCRAPSVITTMLRHGAKFQGKAEQSSSEGHTGFQPVTNRNRLVIKISEDTRASHQHVLSADEDTRYIRVLRGSSGAPW